MKYIVKKDNYDELLKAEKISNFTHTFIEKRDELRKEFALSIERDTPYIDGTTALPDESIDIDFKLFPGDFVIEDIALVHVTDMFPEDGIIKCAKNRVLETYDAAKIKIIQHRLTTHFALNGRVGNNDGGSWDKQKIVIIEPIESHMDKIINFSTGDTIIEGDIKLSEKAIILVHESIYDTIPKDFFSNYNIVKFSGSNTIATNKMLLILGYKPQTINGHGWSNTKNEEKLANIIKTNYPNINFGVHYMSENWLMEKQLQNRDLMVATMRGIDYIDTSNSLSDISYAEMQQLWHNYINTRTNKEDELDFQLFVEFCITHGIIISSNDKITLLNAEDTKKILNNKQNYLNNNIHFYHRLFETISIDKLFDYVGYKYENYQVSGIPENGITCMLHNAYTNWCSDHYNEIFQHNLLPEEIEKNMRAYLKDKLKEVLESYKCDNGYQLKLDNNDFRNSNKECQTISFSESIIDTEIEKRINLFIDEEKSAIKSFIDYICNTVEFTDIYAHLDHIYNITCNHYGNLDSISKENGAKAILMYHMKNILNNYAYNDTFYAILSEEKYIIKQLPKEIIDIEIKIAIDKFIASKRTNNQTHTR